MGFKMKLINDFDLLDMLSDTKTKTRVKTDATAQEVKRPRGRPRKNPLPEETPVIKRPRGRPRKTPVDLDDETAAIVEAMSKEQPKKRVDVKSLKEKLAPNVKRPRGRPRKNPETPIPAGIPKKENLTGDFEFTFVKAPVKTKSKISIASDVDFLPLPVGRSKVIDRTRTKESFSGRADEFAELANEVESQANAEIEEKRRAIRARKAAAIKEAEEAALQEELLAKQQIKEARLRSKLSKVIKKDKTIEVLDLSADIAEDSTEEDIQPAILENYPGENSRSAIKKLRRADNEDDSPFSLALPAPTAIGLDESTYKALQSMFGERSSSIIELLDTDNSDGALSLIMKTLLKTLVDVLPVIENHVRKSGGTKGVYQFTQVTSQLRETCAEIQAYRDRANLGTKVVDRYVRPSFLDIAVQVTSTWVELESQARSKMTPEDFAVYCSDTLLPMKRGIAEYLRKQYEDISASVVQALN